METTKLVQAFETELNLTEKGLRELIEQKKDLVLDVSTEEGFKLARKERTEQNKLLKKIDDLAIGGKKSVDEARSSLKERVSAIYAANVTAFENEDIRRKEAAARKKREEEERIQGIRTQINSICQFATNLVAKSSEELQSIIEAVDMIDVSENFAELTQEAMVVKKETLVELNQALSLVIQNEQLEAEREAQGRLNDLIMIPSGFFGKASREIDKKIHSLSNYEVTEEEFGELLHQANASKEQVIQQLNMMLDHQLTVEKTQAKAWALAIQSEQLEERDELEAEQQVKQEETLVGIWSELANWSDNYNLSPHASHELELIIKKYL